MRGVHLPEIKSFNTDYFDRSRASRRSGRFFIPASVASGPRFRFSLDWLAMPWTGEANAIDTLRGLKRVSLAHLPTPVDPLDRLSALLGGPRVWVKTGRSLPETARSIRETKRNSDGVVVPTVSGGTLKTQPREVKHGTRIETE
jgi:hypothetical protein